jgi:CheY-like chemotaxis protein
VLVVDDDRDTRDTLAVLLALGGHVVRLARDGEEAIKAAKEFRPEVVFLDIRMPQADGYTVCRQLRHSHACREASIYALSALSGPEHDRRCSEAGFTAQLTKPLEPSALSALFA